MLPSAITHWYTKYNDVNDYHGTKRAMPFAAIAALLVMVGWLALWEKPGALFVSLMVAMQVGSHTSYYVSRKRIYDRNKSQTCMQDLLRMLYVSMAAPTIIYIAVFILQQRYLNIQEVLLAAGAVLGLLAIHGLHAWTNKGRKSASLS